MLQIVSKLIDPKHDLVTLSQELDQDQGLLDFSLKIRWIFVALIAGSLELLIGAGA